MIKYLLTILFCAGGSLLWAQLGINTRNFAPNSSVHIDPLGNTLNSGTVTNFADDVFISTSGSVGLGTVTPLAKLDVTGKVKITDGTQGTGKVFTATNAAGLGSWQLLSLVKRVAVWKVSANPASIAANTLYTISGTAAFSLNTLNATSNGTNSVTIPAGNYLIFIRGDINIREYGQMRLFSNGSLIYFKWYGEYLGGGTLYYEFPSSVNLTVGFMGVDVTCASCLKIPFMTPFPYTGSPLSIWSELVIMQI